MALVEVDELVKRYKGAQTNAVDGVSFAIEWGEFFAMFGPSGAGETTTILPTTVAPTGGPFAVAHPKDHRRVGLPARATPLTPSTTWSDPWFCRP